ncbi:lysosomal acid lipase/cholesteryl ester hydrolase-like [Zootoca vivipara]|uniref:lysosomal acid lipase/cholesteryl ester hydrolase-like n=1 Tax=Zootoca vivipara TaxID=8524 RepID=UPI0015916E9F|nr:lysosomal acid lipase/cholesteryl ester hydrolase-like [Zootoca vivipara]
MMSWASILICLVYGSALAHGLIGDRSVDHEATLNAKELIQYWEYPAEEHDVTTDDGYILTVFRIPHGRADSPDPSAGPRPVVFLQHGLLVDAANWFQNLPHNSLAFMLADAGYDVWLGNSRGNNWSRRHHILSPRSPKFWEFSFDQMAKYDLPAAIDYVLQKTGQEQLFYIGHSQGTTMAFIAFSTNPKLAAKIKLYIALGPVATVKHARTPLAKLSLLHEVQIKAMFGMKEFLPKTFFGSSIAAEFCSRNLLAPICGNLLFILCGFNEKNLNLSRVDVYAAQAPSGTSVQNMIHWKQSVLSGKLQAYDYGLFDNLARYNKVQPPEYNIRDMNVTTIVWSGGNDWLSGPEDVDVLIPKIKNLLYHKSIPEWNHLDFVYGLDAADRMYYKIIENLKENL